MGERADLFLSDEEKAIEHMVERILKSREPQHSTAAMDEKEKDNIRQLVLDEFILRNGRPPKNIFGY